jgi:hypothetical protein
VVWWLVGCSRLAFPDASPTRPLARNQPNPPNPTDPQPQGLPSLLLGMSIWRCLPRQPHEARFLNTSERAWLAAASSGARKHAEQAEALGSRRMLLEAFSNCRLWMIMVVGILKNAALTG